MVAPFSRQVQDLSGGAWWAQVWKTDIQAPSQDGQIANVKELESPSRSIVREQSVLQSQTTRLPSIRLLSDCCLPSNPALRGLEALHRLELVASPGGVLLCWLQDSLQGFSGGLQEVVYFTSCAAFRLLPHWALASLCLNVFLPLSCFFPELLIFFHPS